MNNYSIIDDDIICPNCDEKENIHFNYDYTQKDMPVEDVICNECGCTFKIGD